MVYDLIPRHFPVLQGHGLTLRELVEDDLPAWLERRRDPEAAALAGDPPVSSMTELREGLEHHHNAFRSQEAIRWAIVPEAVGRSVGTIGLLHFDPASRSAAAGAAIGRRHWGQGIATRAGRLVLDFGFSRLHLRSIWAEVLPENQRVIRVLGKLGFTRAPGSTGRIANSDLDQAAITNATPGMIRYRLQRPEDIGT
jgi:RimJ/RimL family protein N-acetyltransferase